MENSQLLGLIKSFKRGDMSVFPQIYGEFEGLIKFYCSKSLNDDCLGELNLFFIELLYKIKPCELDFTHGNSLKRYIAVAIKHKYIKLQQQHLKYIKESSLYFENKDCGINSDNFVLADALSALTQKQRQIIVFKYIYGFSDAEISVFFNISRQAVNRTVNRGMDTLKKYYEVTL